MSEIIVTTRTELQAIIAEECNRLYSRLAKQSKPEPYDSIGIDEAVKYLAELDKPLTKPTIYSKASKGTIPHTKFGKRLAFSRKALREWAEGAVPISAPREALSKSANRKRA